MSEVKPPSTFSDLLDPSLHPVLRVAEVAELLQLSEPTIYSYISQGRIPGVIKLSERRFRIATATFAREMLGIDSTATASAGPSEIEGS